MCRCPSLQNSLSPWPTGAQGLTPEPNGGPPGGPCASHLPDPSWSQLCSWQEESQMWAQAMQKGTTSWLWQPTDHQHLPQTHCEPGAIPALRPRERGKSWPGLESGSHLQPCPPVPSPCPLNAGQQTQPQDAFGTVAQSTAWAARLGDAASAPAAHGYHGGWAAARWLGPSSPWAMLRSALQ